jgi:GTP cyclohydrolase I
MKVNGNVAKLEADTHVVEEKLDFLGDNHIASSSETPLKVDAFKESNAEKIRKISGHFREIMDVLGLDLTDDSLRDTPNRVAKMYVNEIFSGLNDENKPDYKLFENKFQYNQMLVEKEITLHSSCEHHFVPILGKAHVGYISNGYVIGLSKINRIVQHFAKRPQVQERLTVQIAEELKIALKTEDVAVLIEAKHMCVCMRGIQDHTSLTTTSSYHGKFSDPLVRQEFFKYLGK